MQTIACKQIKNELKFICNMYKSDIFLSNLVFLSYMQMYLLEFKKNWHHNS